MQGKEAILGPQETEDVAAVLGDPFDMKCFRTAAYTIFSEDDVNAADFEVLASDDGGITWNSISSGTLGPGEVVSETLQAVEGDVIRHTHLKVEIVSNSPGAPAGVRGALYAFP